MPLSSSTFYVYILLCSNDALYTGTTENINRRIQEHQAGYGSKYTIDHHPVELLYTEKYTTLEMALKRERQIKGWTQKKKWALINGNLSLLKMH